MSAKTIKRIRFGPRASMLCLAVVLSGFGDGARPSGAYAIVVQDPPATPDNAPKGRRPRTGRPVKPGATPAGEGEAQVTPPAAGEEKDPKAGDPNAAPPAQDVAAQRQARIEAARKAMEARRAAANANTPDGANLEPPPVTPEPVPQPAEQPPLPQGEPPGGPANHVEIAPVDNNAKPEDRTYSFSFKDASYDQIVEGFARQTGLGVLGDIPADGKVSFVAVGALSFPEALSRMRLLLFNYKPTEPYWIDRTGSHLRVSRVVDLVRNLPLDRWFKSIEDLWAANLPDDELVLVIYTPQSGTPADLRQARDFLPDYVRMTPLEDGNSVSIFALVKDIKKFLDILNMFGTGPNDPRPIVKLEVKYITPSDAVTKIDALMNQDPNAKVRGAAQPLRRTGAQGPNPLDMMQDPMQTIIPDDLQGVIIVRAMQDRIDEIKKLLAVIDVETPVVGYPAVVIPVERAKASALIETLQQILAINAAGAAAEGAGAQPGTPPPPRRRRTARPAAAPLATDGVSLLVHPSQNAIIAIGDEAAVLRVRELVKQFDVAGDVGPIRIALKRALAVEASTSILAALGEGAKRPDGTGINLIADPAGDALWFTGSEFDFKKVQELVGIIDVDIVGSTLHIARLLRQKPSFVASLLTEYDRDPGTATSPAAAKPAAPAAPAARRRAGVAGGPVSKFTPNDEQGLLYVLCSEAEWTAYKAIIDELEKAAGSESFVRVPVEHIDPQSAIDQLSGVIGAVGDPRAAAVKYVPADGAFLVIGAKPTDINDIQAILEQIDIPSPIEQRAFTIRHRPTADIKSAIETLIAGDPNAQPQARRPRPDKGGAAGSVLASLTMFEIGAQLIVKAPPEMMKQIAQLIADLDVETSGTVVRVYSDFPLGSDLDALADSLAGAVADSAAQAAAAPQQRPTGRGGVRGTAEGPKFIPQSAAGKLIVITPPAMIPKIEEMLAILRPLPADVVQVVREFIPLKYAEPEEIVELVTPMLEIQARKLIERGELKESPESSAPGVQAPRRPGQPGAVTGEHFHIAADPRNRWVVLAGPEAIIADARGLIAKLDQPSPGGTEAVFRTVDLKNADPAEMVKAIKEMMGAGGGRIVRRAAPTKGAVAPAEPFDPDTFSVVEAPGGRSVILHGPKDVVEQTVEWIEQLDAQATRGRELKTYTIHQADIKTLAELLLNVVDKPAARPSVRRAPKPARSAGLGFEEEEAELETTKDWIGEEMYIHADFIGGTMVVAAPKAMMLEVDAIVAKFDPEDPAESTAIAAPIMPQHEYELRNRTDVVSAANDLEMLLDGVWQPNDELPKVSASAFGNILIIRYPHPERFAEVDKWIREKIDVPNAADTKLVSIVVPVPEGMTAKQAVDALLASHPELDADVIEIPNDTSDYGTEIVGPAKPMNRKNKCVLPAGFSIVANALVRTASHLQDPPPQEHKEQVPPESEPAPETPEPQEQPVQEEPPPPSVPAPEPIENVVPVPQSDVLRNAAMQLFQSKKDERSDEEKSQRSKAASVPPGTKFKIAYDEVKQIFVIEGPAGPLKDLDDWMEEIQDRLKDIYVPPDFRVVRVRYLDVYTAADILEEMFNATRQQRQLVEQQQAMQQQQLRQQQLAAQRQQQLQQQQAQQQGKGQPAQPQRPDQQQPQQQLGMQQLPPTAVRIYPNPRDKTLILRADASQYPAIMKLLATIDQPQPLNAEIRTFKLDKLNAVEVEDMLRDMLGLDQRAASAAAAGRTSARRRGAAASPGGVSAAGAGGGGGAQLPETLVQELQSGTGAVGIDPEDIKLSSNEQANALVALAPKVALDYIGDLIKKLESEDIPDRITKYYELKNANAGDVADYLEAQFQEHAPGAAGGKGPRPAGPEGRSLNTPSFVPFPPRNMITVLATPTQIEEIDGVIARLDMKDDDEWQNVTLAHADAQAVADTLTQMYGSGAAPARGGRGNAPAAAPSGPGAKFIADDSGRVVFFTAPEGLRPAILDTIAKLEAEAGDTTKIRVIALKYAKASDIATAIDEAYGRSRRAGPPGKAPVTTQLSVTAHDPSGKLFVRADDKTFAEIESLVSLLDQENSTGVEFRIYPLQYANARAVYTVMSSLMRDYLGRLGAKGQSNLETFSVEVDDRANALIVLGTPSVFGFVEENLRKIDTPAAKAGVPGFLMVALKNGDATEVAGNITRLYAQRTQGGSGEPPPQAEANRALNTLIVRGTQAQLDEIKKEVIDPLELQGAKTLTTQTLTLKYADPDAVADSINRIFEDKKRAMQNIRAQGGSPLDFTVVVTPDAITKQIVVQASEDNLALVKARVAELDREDIAKAGSISVRIYSMKYADPNAVASIISTWGRTRTSGSSRPGTPAASDAVSAVAEPATGSVVVTASETNHVIISGLISGLDGETGAIRQRQREVLKLQFASARDVADQLGQVFRAGGPRRGGDTGPTFIASPDTNSIVASVYEDELAEVKKLLAQIDVVGEVATDRTTEMYALTFAEPGALIPIVDGMFRGDRGAARASDQVTAVPEAGTKSLVITASPRNHALVKALIAKLDVESRFMREYHTVTLQKGDAQLVTRALQDLLRGQRGSPSGDQPPQIAADLSTNSLLVFASEAEMADIDKLVKMMDIEPDLSRGRQVKSVHLVNADPGAVQEAISKLFGADKGDVAGAVTAVAEWGSNSVIVSASPAGMTRVDELIKQIDGAADKQHAVHVVTLANADADAVSRTLQDIFVRTAQRGGAAGQQPITISALQGSKALLVRARDDDFAKIEATVAELDREDAVIGGEVRVITLLYSDVTEMQTALEKYLSKPGRAGGGGKGAGELVGDVRISALTQGNSLVISGAKEEVERLEATIKELDDSGEKGSKPQVISLKYAFAADLAPNLTEMFAKASGGGRGKTAPVIVADEQTNRLIVRASATDLNAIEGLVAELDKEDSAGENFRLVQVASGVNVTDVAEKVERTLNDSAAAKQNQGQGRGRQQNITVTPDTRSNTLILAGSPSMFDDAEKLVRGMEKLGPAGGASMKIITLGNVPANEIQQLIDRLKGDESSSGSSRGRARPPSRPRPTPAPSRPRP